MSRDRNFNSLGGKFANNIYGTGKGKIRKTVLMRDLMELECVNSSQPISVLDVGGGQGQIAIELAKLGHNITLLDISDEMIALAKSNAKEHNVLERFTFIHSPLQAYDPLDKKFDLILCHAVFEWLEKPLDTLALFKSLIKPNGIFSLMFFNMEAKRFANIIYGNFEYLANDLKVKKRVKLSPNNPLSQQDVLDKSNDVGFELLGKTGVRCFYDYMRDIQTWDTRYEDILAQELLLSRQEPYASMGRYIHLLLKNPL